VSCEACAEARKVDGLTPECETAEGCPIPPLDAPGRRALEMRALILRLSKLVDPGSVLRMCGADLEDLALLARIEDELNDKGGDDGEGH
jgi:hypothetical protein